MTATFAVTWDDPGDASFTWTFERMHAPEPMTPSDAVAFRCAFDHGASVAAREYGLPFRAATRRINTYLYLALVPTSPPAAPSSLETAIGRLDELWQGEYLPEIHRYLREWEAVVPPELALPQLVDAVAESIERAKRLYEIHFLIWFPFMTAISLFDDFYREILGGVSDFDPYRLLQGFDNMTVASGRALWQLSREALRTESVRAALDEEPAAAVTTALAATPEGRRFLAAVREYLGTWGQRGDRWGWSFPSWIDDPTPVIKTLRNYVRQPDSDLDAELAAQAVERERLVAQARKRMRHHPPDVQDRFEFLLRAAQTAIVLTEDHSHWIDFRCMYHVHRISLEVGRRFAAAAVLDRPDDVFLLTPDELRETALAFPRRNRRSRIAARRAEMEYFRTIAAPPTVGAPPPAAATTDPVSAALAKFFGPLALDPTSADATTISGRPGAPGNAVGTARVLSSLADARRLQPHDVLVAATTAPPWTPLFATAAAVVCDTGGILSHCAVVAREYGIPAVVGTGNATTRIPDGHLVEVDGDAGVVRLLSEPP
jgi:pyruvate,water dikinase